MNASDDGMRALVNDVPVPEFDTTPFTTPPPLREATVAIVTTAAPRRTEDPPWTRGDETFRVLPRQVNGRRVVLQVCARATCSATCGCWCG